MMIYMIRNKDLRPSQIRKSESVVQLVIEAIISFMDPFTVSENDKLYCLSSGAPVPLDVEKDLLAAESKMKFIHERLEQKVGFFEPIKQLKLKTFQTASKTVMIKSKNKLVEYKQQSSIMIQLLVRAYENNVSQLGEIVKFPLSPVPYSIGTADGYLAATNKAKGMMTLVQ